MPLQLHLVPVCVDPGVWQLPVTSTSHSSHTSAAHSHAAATHHSSHTPPSRLQGHTSHGKRL